MSTEQTPLSIATNWYRVDDIERAIARQSTGLPRDDYRKIPANIYSREFAEWLTDQYRLAMAKGIHLGAPANDVDQYQQEEIDVIAKHGDQRCLARTSNGAPWCMPCVLDRDHDGPCSAAGEQPK